MGLRICWIGNTSWCSSGYGIQGRYLLPELRKRGHDISVLAFWGLEGGMLKANGMKFYPKGTDPYGNDIVQAVCQHSGADILISLIDAWVLQDFPSKAPHARWLAWAPVDSEPVPGPVVDKLRNAYFVLPYSRHGEEEFKKAGLVNFYGESNIRYIPHGVATNVYAPKYDKAQAKEALGFPRDCFLAGMVAANKGYPSRKCFDRQFEAFAKFRQRHPDAYLYCHAEPTQVYGGMDLVAEAQSYGLPGGAIRFPDRFLNWLGMPDTWMARAYNAFDVLMSATGGEGFGLPIIESMACGIRVIGTDFTSMRELISHGRTGYKVQPKTLWRTPLRSFQALPDVDDIVNALEWAYAQERGPCSECVEFAQPFEWSRVVNDYWQPLLQEIESRIDPGTRVKQPASEQIEWPVQATYPEYQGGSDSDVMVTEPVASAH